MWVFLFFWRNRIAVMKDLLTILIILLLLLILISTLGGSVTVGPAAVVRPPMSTERFSAMKRQRKKTPHTEHSHNDAPHAYGEPFMAQAETKTTQPVAMTTQPVAVTAQSFSVVKQEQAGAADEKKKLQAKQVVVDGPMVGAEMSGVAGFDAGDNYATF
jgi:hypothetical protein